MQFWRVLGTSPFMTVKIEVIGVLVRGGKKGKK